MKRLRNINSGEVNDKKFCDSENIKASTLNNIKTEMNLGFLGYQKQSNSILTFPIKPRDYEFLQNNNHLSRDLG